MNEIDVKEKTKIIAFYLPQYHCIPENDEWWGKGFTEWTNVKKANPLFRGHNQPRVPLNNNYYNLLDMNVMREQVILAKKYGIYGFCFYHYWFNGKLLLEKPLELLLTNKEIDIPYCFCWANEPWTRAWDGSKRKVIMPQSYGKQEDWEKHFQYLLPFFKDDRYIKINHKPMLVLYKSKLVEYCKEMIDFWDRRCREEGFEGIFFVEEVNGVQFTNECSNSSAVIEFEPGYTINNYCKIVLLIKKIYREVWKNIFRQPHFCSYDFVWKKIICRNNQYGNKERYLGAFVDWDNSPRRGRAAIIFRGMTLEKFKQYFSVQYQKACKSGDRFLFINAWNEWAEGTYLEPDEKNGFGCLEIIKNVTDEEIEEK